MLKNKTIKAPNQALVSQRVSTVTTRNPRSISNPNLGKRTNKSYAKKNWMNKGEPLKIKINNLQGALNRDRF